MRAWKAILVPVLAVACVGLQGVCSIPCQHPLSTLRETADGDIDVTVTCLDMPHSEESWSRPSILLAQVELDADQMRHHPPLPTALTTDAVGGLWWAAILADGTALVYYLPPGGRIPQAVVATKNSIVDLVIYGDAVFTAEVGVGIVRRPLSALSTAGVLVVSQPQASVHMRLDVDSLRGELYFVDGVRENVIIACSVNGTMCRDVVHRAATVIDDIAYEPRDDKIYWIESVEAMEVSLLLRTGAASPSPVEELLGPLDQAHSVPLELALDPSSPAHVVLRFLWDHNLVLMRCVKERCAPTLETVSAAPGPIVFTLGGPDTLLVPTPPQPTVLRLTDHSVTKVVCSAGHVLPADRAFVVPLDGSNPEAALLARLLTF